MHCASASSSAPESSACWICSGVSSTLSSGVCWLAVSFWVVPSAAGACGSCAASSGVSSSSMAGDFSSSSAVSSAGCTGASGVSTASSGAAGAISAVSGFCLFRDRLGLLRGAFRCLLRGGGRALRFRCRVSRCRAACLRCLGGDVGHDCAHGQSFRLCRQQGRCPCAAHSQNQRHGQRCNGSCCLAAGCAGSVKSFFHLSSLPPNLPVV